MPKKQDKATIETIMEVFVKAAFAIDEEGVDAFRPEVVESFLKVGEMLWPMVMAKGKPPDTAALLEAARWMAQHFGKHGMPAPSPAALERRIREKDRLTTARVRKGRTSISWVR